MSVRKRPPVHIQRTLGLQGGECAGPLFVAAKRRAPKVGIRSAARFRFLRRRTPAWADRDCLRALKRLARIYTAALGEQYSEDHIVPLNHPLVCGLHTPANIALILEADNRRKGNSRWPSMPEEQAALL